MGTHDLDDHIGAGQAHGLAVCEAREAEYGVTEGTAFAAGMASSVFVWVMLSSSREHALELFKGIIDDPEILALVSDKAGRMH